ncbi:M48 family metallopeptidase [Candidatus Parcubacteria bacterium]|nr:M48 family metallopeptidase [Candidatus Parcubacteria bacterium]
MEYTLKRSKRARAIRLSVYPDGRVAVSAPPFAALRTIERFLEEKSAWIARTLQYLKSIPAGLVIPTKRGDYARHKETAHTLAAERLAHFNTLYGFSYGTISIRNQKTRWGSCSKRGSLSFNYKIALLPTELADYVVLHELCHRGEFNHSRRFWALMARAMPEYEKRRGELKRIRFGRG